MRLTTTPRWVPRIAVEAAHLDQVREHGGLGGVRDEGALDAALGRAPAKLAYQDNVDLADLAAAYGFGIAKNHPFRDGNKRAAFLSVVMFLGLNGWSLEGPEDEVVRVFVGLAAGLVSETELAEWSEAALGRRVHGACTGQP